jgi:dephospho-CoA kinase
MTPEKLDAMLARQMPDADKCRRADFVVDTGGTLDETQRQIMSIVVELRTRRGEAYQRIWA